jgi:UDP-N-acetyl-D-galactosamine dehydrogenase
VGGHCIGVDPYYLAQKAQEYGYHPEIILAGRRLNDSMGKYVAEQVVKTMIKKNINVNGSKALMLGITFKENCPDVRNTKIVDVIAALEDFGIAVTIYDPWANPDEVMHEYNVTSVKELPNDTYDAIVLGVAHNDFISLDINKLTKENHVVYDVKNILKNPDQKL